MNVNGRDRVLNPGPLSRRPDKSTTTPRSEMLEIGSHPKTVNLKSDTNNLNKNYTAIVDRFKRMIAQKIQNKRN
jgi:hypothetical protein